MSPNLALTALAVIAAVCQVSTAGYAIWAERRARRFERAWRLMCAGPRPEAKTVVAPVFQAPRSRR
jgi:hypothetical protein